MKRFYLLFLLLLGLLPATAHAEGPLEGGTRIYLDKHPVEPFTVTSFAAPNPPVTTDDLWITVQLREGAKAVTDARVWVTVTPLEGGEPARMEARHDLAPSALDYTAHLPVQRAADYEVLIEVEHPRGSGQASYTVNVSEPLTRYIFLLTAVPFLLAAGYLVWRFALHRPDDNKNQ